MKCSIGRILPRIPGPPNQVWPQGVRSAPATEHGSTQLRRFHPGGRDLPQPHARDQVNIVVAGHAESVIEHADRATARLPSEPHHMLFVAARVPHRFQGNSPDLMTRGAFHSRVGGLAARSARARRTPQ